MSLSCHTDKNQLCRTWTSSNRYSKAPEPKRKLSASTPTAYLRSDMPYTEYALTRRVLWASRKCRKPSRSWSALPLIRLFTAGMLLAQCVCQSDPCQFGCGIEFAQDRMEKDKKEATCSARRKLELLDVVVDFGADVMFSRISSTIRHRQCDRRVAAGRTPR